MSNPNDKAVLPPEPITDIGPKDMARLTAYIEAGMPDIIKLTPELIDKMQELYFSSHSYTRISMTMSIKKEIVLYASHKFDWYNKKQAHLAEISARLAQSATETQLQNRDTFRDLMMHHTRIMRNKLAYFDQTMDRVTKEEIDADTPKYAKLKEQYEQQEREEREKAASKQPTVGINVGAGSNVHISGGGPGKPMSMDISPKKDGRSILERIADQEREEERIKNEKSLDNTETKEDKES